MFKGILLPNVTRHLDADLEDKALQVVVVVVLLQTAMVMSGWIT